MGYTPPSTRTKDDANKELKEIELKINEEKQKLYVVVKERENAEAGFFAREQKANKIVSESEEMVTNLEVSIQAKKEEIKEQEKTIVENTSKINKGVDSFNAISSEIISVQAILRDTIAEKDETVSKSKEVIEALGKEISEKTDKSASIGKVIESKIKELSELKEERMKIDIELDEREKALEKRETEQETKLSNIRTISIRLHEKYKDKMSKFEIMQTTI